MDDWPREGTYRGVDALSMIPDELRDDAVAVLASDPTFQEWAQLQESYWANFTPRPDKPELFDQQASFCRNRDPVAFLVGGNACLAGESLIYDPMQRQHRRLDQIDGPFHVLSRNNQTGATEIGLASRPFIKGRARLYRIRLSNGDSFAATLFHRVLDSRGNWREVRTLRIGDALLPASEHYRFASESQADEADTGPSLALTRSPLGETRGNDLHIAAIEFLRQDVFHDLSVWPHRNYEHAGLFHHNSGTTAAAAWKTANFLLRQQPPPRKNTPFWVISNTYEQVMGVCWAEKLSGQQFIPDCEVEWDGIRWYDSKRGLPFSVPLKPWPGRPGKNWVLEFKSYEQGRRSMQARSIGGFWFSEQFPLDIFLEVLRGCREYMFPGGQFAEFTPIDPELCIWVEKVMDDPPEGWKFYRANTACNVANLADGWFDQFFATVPGELIQTRMTGALATFVGCIYPSFNPAVHVSADVFAFPLNITHMRAVDWGASEEHPHATLWGYADGMGDWFIYDEYLSADQTRITIDHAVEIMARSIFWGWPPPWHVFVESEDPILRRFCDLVAQRLEEISDSRYGWFEQWRRDPHNTPTLRPLDTFGYTYADPSRPGEMTAFTRYGVQMAPASNDVYQGINCVRGLLKIGPYSGKPRLWIHPRCSHLVEELRKYRWRKGRTAADGNVLNPEVAKPVPMKRDDDLADCLRYLVFSPTRGLQEQPTSVDHREVSAPRQSIRFNRNGNRRWRLAK